MTDFVTAKETATIVKRWREMGIGADAQKDSFSEIITATGLATITGGTFTRPADTNAYAVGDIIANSVTAGSCLPITVPAGYFQASVGQLRRARLKVNDSAWLNAQIFVHMFKNAPTYANGDNAAFAAGLTESNYLGAFDVTLDRSFSDPMVKGIGVPRVGSEMNFDCAAGSVNLYAVLETRTVITPGSGKIFTLTVEALF